MPLYYRLESRLRELVESKALTPGEALPPEGRLERIFGVSRITVRRAVEQLSRDGLVVARQGVGTFVSDGPRIDVSCLVSFTTLALARGDRPSSRLLEFRQGADVQPAGGALGLAAGEPMFLLRRLRLLNGQPVFLSSAHLPVKEFPGLTADAVSEEGPEQSLYHLVERFGVALSDGEEATCAVRATRQVSDLFDLEPDAPVVQKSCVLRDRRGVPVLYEEAVWGVPERTHVRLEAKR
jgi:GntR family transcriptional regulator